MSTKQRKFDEHDWAYAINEANSPRFVFMFIFLWYSIALILILIPLISAECTSFNSLNDVTKEWAIVPEIGIPNYYPANILLLPSNPPKYEYLVALTPPSGP